MPSKLDLLRVQAELLKLKQDGFFHSIPGHGVRPVLACYGCQSQNNETNEGNQDSFKEIGITTNMTRMRGEIVDVLT